MDIHNYEKRYQAALRGLEKEKISKRSKELILAYNNALILENISKPRLMKYIEILRIVARTIKKDLDKATIDDIKKYVSEIQQGNFSPWTKQTYKVIIRRFYKWFYQTKGYPEIVDWINIRISRSEKRLPSDEDMLNEKDIQRILEVTDHPRDKAFISVLWESGARIGEIGNLKIRNVVFDKYGILILVTGKTGSRKIRLIASTPFISTWVSTHPFRDDKNQPLWVNFGTRGHNQMMSYANMKDLLQSLFKKARIRKRCNPHMFRHSRATFMANHLTEFQMNQYFGWIQGSDMPSTYVHMSGREVDNAILTMNGIRTESKKEESQLQPIICPRCDTINSAGSKHCNKCGGLLDLKQAMEIEEKIQKQEKLRFNSDQLMNLLLNDKEVQELLVEKIQRMGNNFPI